MYAALASFLQARSHHGKWLLRIDDLDSFRIIPEATDQILKTLELYGLYWDDSVFYQSQNLSSYQQALQQLQQANKTYSCVCTRKQLSHLRSSNLDSPIYPGFCRSKTIEKSNPHAIRVKTSKHLIAFEDSLQGNITQEMSSVHGDFIILRKDQVIAYQLAVSVDDHHQHISEVVRGYDLLDSTAKQIHLQQLLGYATPQYMHIPVIADKSGCKLSKQSFAKAVSETHPENELFNLLSLLKQRPPNELRNASVLEQLDWAIINWHPETLKKQRAVSIGN